LSFLEGAGLSCDWKEAAAGRQNMPMEGDEEAIPTYKFSPLLL
jgi:hypothetical protein